MNNAFFFITTQDNISGSVLSSILNTHPDINCKTSFSDPFLLSAYQPNVTIDQFIELQTDSDKKFHGNAQHFTAYQLQHKTLSERTQQPYRKANIILSPTLRVNYLLHSWMENSASPADTLAFIQKRLKEMDSKNHHYHTLYQSHHIYDLLIKTVADENIVDLTCPKNNLFLLAVARLLIFDTADIPTAGRSFSYEQLIHSDKAFLEFTHYLTHNRLDMSEDFQKRVNSQLASTREKINAMQFPTWEPWQINLLQRFTDKRLHTIYYPHIDKPLSAFYLKAGYTEFERNHTITYSKLISIQLNSNRPAQLAAYFDNIEETADNPSDIEVLVNIDIGNSPMKNLLDNEIPKRKFTLKYIETIRPHSFCDLWKPINNLLEITDPDAYFLLNISDEMFFAEKGWDTLLKKYVGFFPDHLFRLRASRNKFRNYFDRWECSFAQDAIPITTKKWIDVGGDWNPCFGPDSFQQLISFYLSKNGMFNNENMLRDVPIIDIKFAGDVPALGIDPEKEWKHSRDHIKAMQICQSYKMQLEASRRAMLIKANMLVYAHQLTQYEIVDMQSKQQIQLINKDNNAIIEKLDYRLNWLAITLTNQFRKLYFFCYFGGGINKKVNIIKTFAAYLRSSSVFFNKHLRKYTKLKFHLRQFIKKILLRLSIDPKKLRSIFNKTQA